MLIKHISMVLREFSIKLTETYDKYILNHSYLKSTEFDTNLRDFFQIFSPHLLESLDNLFSGRCWEKIRRRSNVKFTPLEHGERHEDENNICMLISKCEKILGLIRETKECEETLSDRCERFILDTVGQRFRFMLENFLGIYTLRWHCIDFYNAIDKIREYVDNVNSLDKEYDRGAIEVFLSTIIKVDPIVLSDLGELIHDYNSLVDNFLGTIVASLNEGAEFKKRLSNVLERMDQSCTAGLRTSGGLTLFKHKKALSVPVLQKLQSCAVKYHNLLKPTLFYEHMLSLWLDFLNTCASITKHEDLKNIFTDKDWRAFCQEFAGALEIFTVLRRSHDPNDVVFTLGKVVDSMQNKSRLNGDMLLDRLVSQSYFFVTQDDVNTITRLVDAGKAEGLEGYALTAVASAFKYIESEHPFFAEETLTRLHHVMPKP